MMLRDSVRQTVHQVCNALAGLVGFLRTRSLVRSAVAACI